MAELPALAGLRLVALVDIANWRADRLARALGFVEAGVEQGRYANLVKRFVLDPTQA